MNGPLAPVLRDSGTQHQPTAGAGAALNCRGSSEHNLQSGWGKLPKPGKGQLAKIFLSRKEGCLLPCGLLASGNEEGLGLTPRSECVRETPDLWMCARLPSTFRFVVVVVYLGKLAALWNLHRRDSLVQIVHILVIRCISANKWIFSETVRNAMWVKEQHFYLAPFSFQSPFLPMIILLSHSIDVKTEVLAVSALDQGGS